MKAVAVLLLFFFCCSSLRRRTGRRRCRRSGRTAAAAGRPPGTKKPPPPGCAPSFIYLFFNIFSFSFLSPHHHVVLLLPPVHSVNDNTSTWLLSCHSPCHSVNDNTSTWLLSCHSPCLLQVLGPALAQVAQTQLTFVFRHSYCLSQASSDASKLFDCH